MKNDYTVLLMDNYPLVIDSYKRTLINLSEANTNINFQIEIATDSDQAYQRIKDLTRKINVVILEINLPPAKNKKFLSGDDIALKIKELIPESRIIISTSFNDNYRINNILKNINPDGLLIKEDLTSEIIGEAVLEVLNDPPYYSKTVTKLLRKKVTNDFLLDKNDWQGDSNY